MLAPHRYEEKATMKCCAMLVLTGIVLSANAQEGPRVFIRGKGSENVSSSGSAAGGRHWGTWGSKSTIDAHDESMEVTKDLQKECSGITVTISQANADYIIMMNRESKQNRGLLRTNSQVQVANRAGDILGSKGTYTVGGAAKDACSLILADWQVHGSLKGQERPTAPASEPASVKPVVPSSPVAAAAPAFASQSGPVSAPAVVTVPSASSQGVVEVAKKERQHKACLALAKDNPSITCN